MDQTSYFRVKLLLKKYNKKLLSNTNFRIGGLLLDTGAYSTFEVFPGRLKKMLGAYSNFYTTRFLTYVCPETSTFVNIFHGVKNKAVRHITNKTRLHKLVRFFTVLISDLNEYAVQLNKRLIKNVFD